MNWRKLNGAFFIASIVLLVMCCGLWAVATLLGFIGSTVFIGHISMLALVLAMLSAAFSALAAWRADVPTE